MALRATYRPVQRTIAPLLAVTAFGVAACNNSQESSEVPGTTPPVWTAGNTNSATTETPRQHREGSEQVELRDPTGRQVGTAHFATVGGKVRLTVDAQGLTPGFHGLHIHQYGKCEPNSIAPSGGPPGHFLSAGGHLHLDGPEHHPAAGDMTALQVGKDGTGRLVTTTDSITVDQITGKAVILHAGPDNFANIPNRYQAGGVPGPDAETLSTGDSGPRIACGVIG
ncbi:superoxide dismutase[Cu-Zn] [Nocardia carnea]|uniref:superoxide dismutase[Cu-Zn] n=1 Tax=Nocardia carnea TaxID=37328 RepID=UPI002456FED6|nr:superoxide dismutase family protein [Nocardia carnea]